MSRYNGNPYALLDRAQSRRVPSVPVGDALQLIMARTLEAPPYEELINYPRAKDKDEIRCVMCGLPPGPQCVIPRQNKDVCKDCDKSTWRHCSTDVYFKWCKGCKKFLRLGSFSEKLDAAKCDRCRERGRQSYLVKKGKDGNVEICVVGHHQRSRSNSINSCSSMPSDFESELADTMSIVSAAAAMASARGGHPRSCVSSSLSEDEMLDLSSLVHSDHAHRHTHEARSRGSVASDSYGGAASPLLRRDSYDGGHDGDDDEGGEDEDEEEDDDTLSSARAVVSFMGSPSFRTSTAPAHRAAVAQTSTSEEDGSVYIDDDTADVTTSKLSSVFGKPLRELQRSQPAAAPTSSAAPSSAQSSAHSPRPTDRSESDATFDVTPDKDGAGGDSDDGGCSRDVGSALSGTLYELACIHQRIVTLEEHAARVKYLEAALEAHDAEKAALTEEATALRAELAEAVARSAAAEAHAAALQAECNALKASREGSEPPSSNPASDAQREVAEEGDTGQLPASTTAQPPPVTPSSPGPVKSSAPPLTESPPLTGALTGFPDALALSELAVAMVERAQKRPRLVSLGE